MDREPTHLRTAPTRRARGTTPPPEVWRGAVLDGFQIVERLAGGGFGTVYRARDLGGGDVALKILHAELVGSSAAARLEREAAILRELAHPGIVRGLGCSRTPGGRPYLVMELVPGTELTALLDGGPLAPAALRALFRRLCAVVGAVHAAGYLHRDLKASNVLVGGNPRWPLTLIDFGIARPRGGVDDAVAREVVGTPACMPPEQARGDAQDERTDVYALGALLYHAATGRFPHEASAATIRAGEIARPLPPVGGPWPAALDDVIARATAPERDARYGSAAALAAAIDETVPV